MNKIFLTSWLAVFVVLVIGGFAVHGAWLADSYTTLPNIMRTDEESMAMFPLMLLAQAVTAAAFVWIYQRGAEQKSWMNQGFRYGIAIALFAPATTATILYVVQQIPGELATRQAIGDSLVVIVAALVAAFLNRDTASD